jgi:hypothetical protein
MKKIIQFHDGRKLAVPFPITAADLARARVVDEEPETASGVTTLPTFPGTSSRLALVLRLHVEPPGGTNRNGQPRPDWAKLTSAQLRAYLDRFDAWRKSMPGARVTLGVCLNFVEALTAKAPTYLSAFIAEGNSVILHDHADAQGYARLRSKVTAIAPKALTDVISGMLERDVRGLLALNIPLVLDGLAWEAGHKGRDMAAEGFTCAYPFDPSDPLKMQPSSKLSFFTMGNGDWSQPAERFEQWARTGGQPAYQDGVEIGRLQFSPHMAAIDFDTLTGVSPPDTAEVIAAGVNRLASIAPALSYTDVLRMWADAGRPAYSYRTVKDVHKPGDNHYSDAGGTA